MSKGLLVVFSGPSGAGKGTVLGQLLAERKDIRLSISATTRSPRPGEQDGREYFFLTREEFLSRIEQGKMLEYAEYCGNFYGTPADPIERWTSEGNDVILEIEVQGGAQVKKKRPDCVSIFIVPPSLAEQERRLRGRGTEDEETIQKRVAAARGEIAHAPSYDYIVVNDTVEHAVNQINQILAAEKLRFSRCSEIIEGVLNHHAETVC